VLGKLRELRETGGLAAADGDGHRHGARPDREWHGERIEAADFPPRRPLRPGADGVLRHLLGIQELPAERRHDESPGDAHHGQLDAEELEQPGTERHRPEQQREAVDRRLAREHAPFLDRQARRQPEEERRRLERIDDGEEPREGQQERAHDRVHGLAAASS
jgi:hypothetical protein